MKILHTSDWHLGHRLYEQSQHEEQAMFLAWLIGYIDENNIDVLLVAGDIFDVGVPSAQSQKLYFDFLIRLHSTSCREVIITGGNHDAPSTLNAPKDLLNALSIRVVGKATEDIHNEIYEIDVDNEKLIIAAAPYLRDQDIRRAISSESADEINNRYKTALIKHYADLAEACRQRSVNGSTTIAMGHLFAQGAKTSDSEQTIYVGNLGDIGASDFPAVFDYIALGHLHRSQCVGAKNHIRYSGSPYILSFSEVGQAKKIIELETGTSLKINEISIPSFREIVQIAGTIEHCKTQLLILAQKELALIPWVEVILTEQSEAITGYTEIYNFVKDLNLEVLKVTVNDNRKYDQLKSLVDNARQVKTLQPIEVFRLKCEEQSIDLVQNPEMLDAFNEIVQLATEIN